MSIDRGKCLLILAASLTVPALSGCGGATSASDAAVAAERARSQVEQGPVRVTAEIQPVQPRLSDLPTLTLTIDSEEGVTVEKPQFGERIGRFKFRDLREALPKSKDGRVIAQEVFTLEPTEAGRLRIDPIPIYYTDRRPQGDAAEHAIETEPLTVEVSTVLGDKPPSLNDFHGATGPIGLPGGIPAWAWPIVAVALVVAAAYLWRKRRGPRKTAVTERILTPEEIANMELDKLVASGLAATDVKQFYVELTGIVRRYIERTTGIRAPEQTTEEFLREISRASSLSQWERARVRAAEDTSLSSSPAPLPKGEGSLWDLRSRLRDFLESADLVKFAAHQPNAGDIDRSVQRARLFVAAKSQQETATDAGSGPTERHQPNMGHSERSEESNLDDCPSATPLARKRERGRG